MATDSEFVVFETLDAVAVSLPIAGLGSRGYAFIIDWHIRILAALVWAFGALLSLRWLGERDGAWNVLGAAVPAMSIYFGYHPVLETLRGGQTPGKRIAGIRVLKNDGSVAGFGTHLTRNLFRLLDCLPAFYALGLVVTLSNARHCRIGDFAAGTILVVQPVNPAGSVETLSASPLVPQLTVLVDELVLRWKELEPGSRTVLARQMLERGGVRVADDMTDRALRKALLAMRHG